MRARQEWLPLAVALARLHGRLQRQLSLLQTRAWWSLLAAPHPACRL
jgi:hypothetical protein